MPSPCSDLRNISAAMSGLLVIAVIVAAPAPAQTWRVLHNFTGETDGGFPVAGLTIDAAGNLFGTASTGGNSSCVPGCGTVFRLQHRGSGWEYSVIYSFSGSDGENPQARVIIGPDGSLYGTTVHGGSSNAGVVFKLQPPPTVCKAVLCAWQETVLYSFRGGSDGENPMYGDLVFDQAGNLYGTTYGGGGHGRGTVYELSSSGGQWTETVLYSFAGDNDGQYPTAGVIFDSAGNLYGTALNGGSYNGGTLYKLTHSMSGWTESTVYSFDPGGISGYQPVGGLVIDLRGNLYGTTETGGVDGGGGNPAGTAYELVVSGGGWSFNLLYTFTGTGGSFAKPTLDSSGNVLGTLFAGNVEVFRLSPSNGQWTLTGFTGSVGANPVGNVIFDAAGSLYSTTYSAGRYGAGVAFQLTP